jgi:hypothetical protein
MSLYGNKNTARWLAIVGVVVSLSACAACLLVLLVLNTAYGGQTVALRNPFAAPIVPDNGNSGNSGSTGGGAPSAAASPGGGVSGTTDNGTSPGTSGSSGGSVSSAPGAAGSSTAAYIPTLSGYATANASTIQGAFDLIASTNGFASQSADDPNSFSAQSLSLGAIATSLIVSRVDEFIACYRDVGAVEAQVYIRNDLAAIAAGEVPPLGAVAVINQDRLRDNLVACAVSPNDPNSFSAQAAQPCGDFGQFSAAGDTFTYLYAGTDTQFCDAIETYYNQF